MYIVKVLIEHPVMSLDTTFDYLSHCHLVKGIRVKIEFNRRMIIGYVEDVRQTSFSKQELEQKSGFQYHWIHEVIDEEPLLNEELQMLAKKLSRLTFSPRIACLQAMLPTQLKPNSSKGVSIKKQKIVRFVQDGKAKTTKQQQCLDIIKEHVEIPVKDISFSKSVLDQLVMQKFIEYAEMEIYRNPRQSEQKNQEVILTDDQKKVVEGILSSTKQVSLIHGVTGSGKTEIYLALAKKVLDDGKTVIMLVPEISLTPMMVDVFQKRFGQNVAILHSRLTQGEKYDEYRRIMRQEVKIVVGARSAIFAPLKNIGLIILDEEHDASYKQESKPRYLTSQIAKIRAQYYHGHVVLGSATPSLESYSRAKKGVYDLFELPKRINQKPLPEVKIVDMLQEMKNGNYSFISHEMASQIQETIDRGEQVILLLNKRGYATYLQCQDCGEVVKCPHCDVTLTYHKSENVLKCHYCDYRMPYPKTCPKCQHQHYKMVGYGTQKIEEQLEMQFSKARVLRYDVDTTRRKDGHFQLLEKFRNQEANILLGTQMIAKGLDFENVTFVGVLNADMSLNIPDFRASERTFQLLCQVSGRSGRGKKTGTVIIQTYNPTHYAIVSAAHHDYSSFYNQEMKYRQAAKYPPYCHLLSLIISSSHENRVHQTAQDIKDYLEKHLQNVMILGPAKSMIYRMNDIYRERILIKFISSDRLFEVLENINDYYNRKQKGKVSVICDMNPYSQI